MSAREGKGKPNAAAAGNYSSFRGKSTVESSNNTVEQLRNDVADISLNATAQDDGQWEVFSKKSKNRGGSSSARAWGSQNSNSKSWGHSEWAQGGSGRASANAWPAQAVDSRRPTGRGNIRGQAVDRAPQPAVRPPLEHGWNWKSRAGNAFVADSGNDQKNVVDEVNQEEDDEEDEEDDIFDDTDDELLSDDFDSDTSQQSHGTRKKCRWFKDFFETLDSLSNEELNEPARQWHCSACQGGPGAIDWYKGLQPLMTHAKTKGSKRVKLHRELAELLEEELRRRGTSVIPSGEVFGKWKGLDEEEKDHEIVWPPMVVIMNTRLDMDDNDKWTGMGNQELLDYFSNYAAVRARHSYGPQGHRGMSVLIFEASAAGYMEAERLHKHLKEEGADRNAWERRRRGLFHSGGNRQLFGYMALKEDLEVFNQHSQGKSRLKYEMRSYHEMVTTQIRQMKEDNQQLLYFKNKAIKEKLHSKAVEESLGIVSEKLRKTMEENRIVRQRTQMHHEQNKEELDYQEQFFNEQIRLIHEARDAKEEDFEKIQQEEREKVKQLSSTEDARLRVEKVSKFIQFQEKEIEEFVVERDALVKTHEDSMAELKKRHWEELVAMEKQFDDELAKLMEKYTPHHTDNNPEV